MGRNNPKGWKNGIFVPFFLCLHFVLSSLLCEMGVSVVQMSISLGVESWFVVGCFIADEYVFVGECFYEGGFGRVEEWMGWFDRMRGWLGIGRRCSYARVYARSRPTSFVFLLSQVSQRMELKILHHPKNDVSFYRKQRVVLLKTSCRFAENNVSFYWKQRVVLLKTSYRFMENNVLFWIGGRKVVLRMVFWGFLGVE